MPGTITRQASKRKEVTAQETFRYTTPDMKVTARPVDAYVDPAKPRPKDNSGLEALMQGLNALAVGMQRREANNSKEDYEKGQVMALKGEEPPPGSPEAMWKGNQHFKGQSAVIDLQSRYEQLLQNSAGMTQDEFVQELHKTSQDLMKGQSDHYLMGMLKGGALGLEKQAMNAFRKTSLAAVKEDTTSAMATAFSAQFSGMQDKSPAALHGLYTTFLDQAVHAGVDRKVAADRLVDVIGTEAVRSGNPDLLGFAQLTDSKGIAPIGTAMQDKILGYTQRALNARDRLEANAERDANKARKEKQDYVETEMTSFLYNMDSTGGNFSHDMTMYLDNLEKNKHALDPGAYTRLRKEAESVMERGDFRKVSDKAKYLEAAELATTGDLKLSEYAPYLSATNAKELLAINASAKNKMNSHAYSQSVSNAKFLKQDGLKTILGEKDFMGNYAEGAQEKASKFNVLYLQRLEEARQQTQDGSVGFDVIKSIRDQSIADVMKEETPKQTATVSSGNAATKSAGGKSAQAQSTPEAKPQDAMSRLDRLISKKKGE